MKKVNLPIAVIIATFVVSMFAFQPTASEVSNNAAPLANPTPRRIRAVPTSTREPIRKIKAKYPTNYKEGGVNDMTFRRMPRRNGKH